MPEFLFKPVPHTDAIDFIRSKPVVSREVFDQLLPELQARAFTISGMVPADVAQTVRDLIADVPAGMTWDAQKKLIAKALAPYTGESEAIAKAELLLRVHGQEAYASAADAVMRRQVAVFPYWQYRTMGDSKVRPSHRALNGLVLPANSPFWKTHDPPWEWGCRCIKIPLSDDDVNDIRARQAKNDLEGGFLLSDRLRQELEMSNRLVRGAQVHDVTPTGSFKFNPQDLTLSVDQLRARYKPDVWAQFESWARKTEINPRDRRTVWNWINGEPGPPEIASVAAPVRFEDSEDAQEWADRHMHPEDLGLDTAEKEALRDYQQSGFQDINKALRGEVVRDPQIDATIGSIDRAIARAKTPAPIVAWRGVDPDVVAQMKVGDVWADPAFFSTSLSRESAHFFSSGAVFEIIAPAGTRAIYLDELVEGLGHEVELLFPRGTKFRIVSKETIDETVYIRLEPVR